MQRDKVNKKRHRKARERIDAMKALEQKSIKKHWESKAPAKKQTLNSSVTAEGKIGAVPKHPGGRPPKYRTPEELQEKITAYFDSCWIDKVTEVTDKDGNCTMSTIRYQARPYTVMGLALALGFNSRQSLLNYQARSEFLDIIKRAKQTVEMYVEERLLDGKNAAGPIFWLKNHAGYRDKRELEHTGADGGPVAVRAVTLTDDELLAIARGGKKAPEKV